VRLYIVIFAIVAITLIPTLILDDEIDEQFGGEQGLARLRGYGDWAWAAGVGLIISDLFLPVPSTAVIAGLGMLYGPWLGGLIGGVGSVLAGLVAFGLGRTLGRPALRVLCGDADLDRLARFFSRHGLWAIALSRWMPLLPEALCGLAGSARMRFPPFIAALACGSFAMGFAFGFLGTAYLDRPAAGLILSALIPLAVWPPVHYFMTRRPAPAPAADPTAPGT
jgi:uncharacterized membrane protein YdjX (TVP38/TMEM64 family)